MIEYALCRYGSANSTWVFLSNPVDLHALFQEAEEEKTKEYYYE